MLVRLILGPVTPTSFHLKMQRYWRVFTSYSQRDDEDNHDSVSIRIHNPKWIDLKEKQYKTERFENALVWLKFLMT